MTDVQQEVFRLDEGLDLLVSHSPKSLQCAATLLLAVSRMKKSLTRFGRELRDAELCSVIMDSLVDETVVQSIHNFSTREGRNIFLRANSVKLFTLCDTSQKDLVHESGELKLQAVTLKGGHSERKVNFKLSRYITPHPPDAKCQIVLLSITNNNLHISCSMKDDVAVLSLESYSDEKDLEKISEDGNQNRFLFYRRTSGVSVNTFESVACSGWYISTSYEGENEPVEMCKMDTAQRLTTFKIN